MILPNIAFKQFKTATGQLWMEILLTPKKHIRKPFITTNWSGGLRNDRMTLCIKINNEGYSAVGTPVPGTPDPAEYPRLAAYAYYRIMLIHLVQGHDSEATTVYNTLQEKFGNDQYGSPYVEMATAFWEAYQSTHKMYDGCAAAIQYAAEHPDILIPLGSDYHGAQSHIYKPEDVCPFR